LIEQILNNPNATLRELTLALAGVQGIGSGALDAKAKERIKKRLNQLVSELAIVCVDINNSPQISKKHLAVLRSFAQAFGFTAEEEQVLESLFDKCRRKFTFEAMIASGWGRTDTLRAQVCGFVDDDWFAIIDLVYSYACGGGTGASGVFGFSLAPGGGRTTAMCPWDDGSATVCGYTSSLIGGPVPIKFDYDGFKTITFSIPGVRPITNTIQAGGSCTDDPDALPEGFPLPVNNENPLEPNVPDTN